MSAWPPPDPPGGPHPPVPPPSGYITPPGGGYPPPGYPPPGGFGPGYPGPPQRRGTDEYAITSLALGIFGFFLITSIVAIILGIVALGRIGRTGQSGRGLAISGIVLGVVWMLFLGLGILGAATNEPDRGPAGDLVDPSRVAYNDLMLGDCVTDPPTGQSDVPISSFAAVPCSQLHTGEVFAVLDLPDGPYPGDAEVRRLVEVGCNDRLAGYAPSAPTDPGLMLGVTYPPEAGWAQGDRRALCFLVTAGSTTGSLKGR